MTRDQWAFLLACLAGLLFGMGMAWLTGCAQAPVAPTQCLLAQYEPAEVLRCCCETWNGRCCGEESACMADEIQGCLCR